MRKKSLIGGTDVTMLRTLVGEDVFFVIPFNNIQIVFCPIVDLWALDDARKKSTEKVLGKDVSKENFLMTNYTKDFKIPMDELSNLPKSNLKAGVEFFISSPCLLLHESKVEWLKSQLA